MTEEKLFFNKDAVGSLNSSISRTKSICKPSYSTRWIAQDIESDKVNIQANYREIVISSQCLSKCAP